MDTRASVQRRISTAFHETLPLSTPQVREVMHVSLACGERFCQEGLRELTGLGTNAVKAMPLYARGCGLLEIGSYRLTRLGEAVCAHDPDLRRPETLWLMHYHLSAPYGPGPKF